MKGRCSIHGLVEAKYIEAGVSKKTGKPFQAFWTCSKREVNGKCQIEMANTPTGKFEQELDSSAVQTDSQKRDQTITRLAIAKSLLEAGRNIQDDPAKVAEEGELWVKWVNERK